MTRVILFPAGGQSAREHYESTVESARSLAELSKYIDSEGLNTIYYGDDHKVALWGMTGSNRMDKAYDSIKEHDLVMFVRERKIISYAMVLMKIKSPVISEEMWGSAVWSNVLFLTDVENTEIPMESVIAILNYKPNFILQGTFCLDDRKSRLVLENNPAVQEQLERWKQDAQQTRKSDNKKEKVINPRIFISYSHADEPYKDNLKKHLAVLIRDWGAGDIWDDRELIAGDDFNDQIFGKIQECNMHILLISADYFASDYCMDEFKKIMESGKIVIPIIVRACYWKKIFSKYGRSIITFPANNGNIFSSGDEDSEFAKIVEYLDEKLTKRLKETDL